MSEHKFFERVRRHPILGSGAVLLLGLGALEVDGYVSNPTYNVPKDSCVSPFAVSRSEVDHDANTFFQTWSGIDTTGVIASGTLPEGAYGVEVAFENPDQLGAGWSVSHMIKADNTGRYLLKMAIGSGEVEFGVRIVAHEGSESCTTVPSTSFQHVGTGDYATADGQLPWPQPVNITVNALLTLF
jgi:hypothetical protein